jgi:hypothetical protein
LQLLKTINIYLIFYISLFKYILLGVTLALIIEIQLVNLNAEYKVSKILNYKYISKRIKYLIK